MILSENKHCLVQLNAPHSLYSFSPILLLKFPDKRDVGFNKRIGEKEKRSYSGILSAGKKKKLIAG